MSTAEHNDSGLCDQGYFEVLIKKLKHFWMESGSDIQSIEYQNEYIVSIKSPNDHIIIMLPFIPPEIMNEIMQMKNEMEEADTIKAMQREVVKSIREDYVARIWDHLCELLWDYDESYREWCNNSIYFDVDYMEELVNEIYEYYEDHRDMLLTYMYVPAHNCGCCKLCQNRRVNIETMLEDDYSKKGWKRYHVRSKNCQECDGRCVRVCDQFYNLEFRRLWRLTW